MTTDVATPAPSRGAWASGGSLEIAVGTAVGAAGGTALAGLGHGPLLVALPMSAVAGGVFALLTAGRCQGPGSGLPWGLAYGLLLWWLGPMLVLPIVSGAGPTLDGARAAFPLLVGFLLCLGMPLGLALGACGVIRRRPNAWRDGLWRAAILGVLSGAIGGWAFGQWMAQADLFPLIAGLVRSGDREAGIAVHYAVAVVIGASFGLLFQPDLRGSGSSLIWGLGYGLFWWFLGPLTLLPLLLGAPIDWSVAAGAALFDALVGHAVYGLVLGLTYGLLDRLWVGFFIESDPINREPEGPGLRALHAMGWGALASVAGALLFGLIMYVTDALPVVASLVGATSPVAGFLVHLGVAAIIGMTFGLLFRHEATSLERAIGWGMCYGTVWWFLGPLTLLPVFLDAPLNWSVGRALASAPSLLGHLIYGVATAVSFSALEGRHAAWHGLDPRFGRRAAQRRRPAGSPAPALWFFVLTVSVALPALLDASADGAPGGYGPYTRPY